MSDYFDALIRASGLAAEPDAAAWSRKDEGASADPFGRPAGSAPAEEIGVIERVEDRGTAQEPAGRPVAGADAAELTQPPRAVDAHVDRPAAARATPDARSGAPVAATSAPVRPQALRDADPDGPREASGPPAPSVGPSSVDTFDLAHHDAVHASEPPDGGAEARAPVGRQTSQPFSTPPGITASGSAPPPESPQVAGRSSPGGFHRFLPAIVSEQVGRREVDRQRR